MKYLFENFYINLCLIKTRLYIKDYRHIKWRSTFLPYLVEMRIVALIFWIFISHVGFGKAFYNAW